MNEDNIILGIDPGTTIMGFGIIKATSKEMSLIQMNELQLKKYENHFPFVTAELRRSIDEKERWKDTLIYLDRMYLYKGLDWRPLWQDLIDEVESYMR